MSALASAPPARKFRGVVPNVGIWPNIPFEEYVAWDAVNHSSLRRMADSPLHYKHARDEAEPYSSDALRFGTLLHTQVLEPERFDEITVPAPINPKTGNAYGMDTKAWAEYAAAHPGKLIVSLEECDRIGVIAHRVRTHRQSGVLFGVSSLREVCIVWDCPETGIRCKGRVDYLAEIGPKAFLRTDLKTCASAKISELRKSLIAYGYHTQDEFYRRGFKALGFECSSIVVAAETVPPHDVVVYQVGEDTRKAAATQVGEWLSALRRCTETGEWPGYADDLVTLDAPEWYFKQFADGE